MKEQPTALYKITLDHLNVMDAMVSTLQGHVFLVLHCYNQFHECHIYGYMALFLWNAALKTGNILSHYWENAAVALFAKLGILFCVT